MGIGVKNKWRAACDVCSMFNMNIAVVLFSSTGACRAAPHRTIIIAYPTRRTARRLSSNCVTQVKFGRIYWINKQREASARNTQQRQKKLEFSFILLLLLLLFFTSLLLSTSS